jgi:UDP-N-acetylmuramoylalanine--D-glutamate ligase
LEAPGARVEGGMVVLGDQPVCRVSEVGLIGPHNLENVCAAVTAAQAVIGDDFGAMQRAVKGFKGLEHRLELAGTVREVRYFDDSFSTTPETAIAAIQAFTEPKVLILGGSDKKSKYDGLARVVAGSNVREVVLIGEMADRISAALQQAGYNSLRLGGTKMDDIVAAAARAARPGDVVLLSPACASFDMFKNYKDRGDQFKQAVSRAKP